MGSIVTKAKKLLDLRRCIKTIERTDTGKMDADTKFWLSWYGSTLKNRMQFGLRNDEHLFAENLAQITQQDKLVLKDIKMPRTLKPADDFAFVTSITDSLLDYLLDSLPAETLYSMIPTIAEGPYEYKEVQLREGDIVIDAGASIGEFAALAGIKGCSCYAFEPIPSILEDYLSKTAEWNPHIEICEYALSDQRGDVLFDVMPTYLGSSSFVSKHDTDQKIKVETIDLDTFAEEKKLPTIDFIKADIEGAERYMLMGAKRVLKEFAPRLSICTYHYPDDPVVLRKLILEANPDYVVEERFKKMYAYVPGK